MNVNTGSNGKTKITFRKREVQILSDAERILSDIGRCAQDKEATDAAALVKSVKGKFVPVQKELSLETA